MGKVQKTSVKPNLLARAEQDFTQNLKPEMKNLLVSKMFETDVLFIGLGGLTQN